MTRRRITFVKKILADGTPCGKCRDVQARLERDDHLGRIDRILIADERDPNSEGMRLANELEVDRAPFFVVETSDKTVVYTVFLKFMNEVLSASDETDDAQLLLAQNPGLDLI
jgi:hypothetical protein